MIFYLHTFTISPNPGGALPIYPYVCNGCKHAFTALEKIIQRNELKTCPVCGKSASRNTITACGINTRGAGTGDSIRTPRHAKPLGDTANLPTVGRDGKLYATDGKTILAE
jgi:putative FmdB family regulatory protein